MAAKRTQVLVRLDPALLERIDAARPGTRNDWLLEAIEAYLPGSVTAPGRVEFSTEVSSSSGVQGVRSWMVG